MRGGAKRGGGFRINEEIRIREGRLIKEDGEMMGVVPTEDAQQMASDAGLDLVEVSPNADPPVCKILDYGKYKYEQQKQEHETRKRQRGGELKEVRFRPKTDTHDKQIKVDRARAFLEDGHRVQLTMMFRGREMQHRNLGVEILTGVAKGLEDIAKLERHLRSEGRRMHLLLMPKPGLQPSPKPKKPKKPKEPKEQKESDELKESMEPKESDELKESMEPKESDEPKESMEPKGQDSDAPKEDKTPEGSEDAGG